MIDASLDTATVIMAIFLLMRISHRRILIVGHSLMTLCTALIAVFFYFEIDYGILITTFMYLIVFLSTTGPCSFTFVTEVCTDIALGIGMSQILTSLGLFYFMNKNMVRALEGEYVIIYAVFTIYGLMAFAFSYKNVKETKEKTDKEKKLLYAPDFKAASV
jgi:SP family arabinose:H+ symporter-like MFS transporter